MKNDKELNKLESRFIKSMKDFINENKSEISDLMFNRIDKQIYIDCDKIIEQSLAWYRSELNYFFENCLKDQVKKCMDQKSKDIGNVINDELSILLSTENEFIQNINSIIKKKIISSIQSGKNNVLLEALIEKIIDKK